MRKLLRHLPLILLCGCVSPSTQNEKTSAENKPPVKSGPPIVAIKTSMGDIKVELFEKAAPVTVRNFLAYVNSKHYNGTLFHRVISGFMIQGGGFTEKLRRKPTMPPIKNEAENGLRNKRGTIAMARTPLVDSATDQFFINLKDNTWLDNKDHSAERFGYCVFGKVLEGMDVVDKIAEVRTMRKMYFQNLPVENVVIKEIVRIR